MSAKTIQSAYQSNYKIKRTFGQKIVGYRPSCRLLKTIKVIETDRLIEMNVLTLLPPDDVTILKSDIARLYPRFNKEHIEIMRIEDSSIATVIDESMALSCSEIMHFLSKKDYETACGISVVSKVKYFVDEFLKSGWALPSGDEIFKEDGNEIHLIKNDNELKTITFKDKIMEELRSVEELFKSRTDITFQDEGIYFRKTKIKLVVLFNKVILNISYNDFETDIIFES